MERIRYALIHPIETISREGGTEKTTTITELLLAPRVKGRHMRATDHAKGPIEAKLLLISSLAGITRAEADELDEADLMAIDGLYDEEADLAKIAGELGIDAAANVDQIRLAIRQLRTREGLHVPLVDGASSPEAGPGTGPMSSVT